MNEIKMVVFDMAGTTIKDKNEVEKCFMKAANQTHLSYTRTDILSMMGWSKKKVFEVLWKKAQPDYPEDKLASLVTASYIAFKNILENHYKTAKVVPTDGCLAIFKELKDRGIKIALTTGFYREVTNIILQRLDWNKGLDDNYVGNSNSLIDISIASDEVPSGRPDPHMIYRAMQLLGVEDSMQVINVGDTPSDLLAGKNAKCKFSLAVTNGTHTSEQLGSVPHGDLLNTIDELKNYI